jgi:hypothetical protein
VPIGVFREHDPPPAIASFGRSLALWSKFRFALRIRKAFTGAVDVDVLTKNGIK